MQRSFIYTGRIASGMTLASIIHIVTFNAINPKYYIVSNLHLKELPFKFFDKEKILEYHDSIILFDSSFSLPVSSRYRSNIDVDTFNLLKFLNQLEENNNILITNTHVPEYIISEIRNEFEKIHILYSVCNYDNENKTLLVKSEKYSVLVKNVDKYFKYYNYTEIPRDLIKDLLKEN